MTAEFLLFAISRTA